MVDPETIPEVIVARGDLVVVRKPEEESTLGSHEASLHVHREEIASDLTEEEINKIVQEQAVLIKNTETDKWQTKEETV